MNMYELLFENKIKGADGKACWDGYRYDGTENGKDKCVPVKEEGVEETMDISMEPDNESRDAVKSAICNRITRMHVPLLSKYGLDAVLQAIDDVADWVGDVDEIGSSDVSAWTKDVIQTLERQGG